MDALVTTSSREMHRASPAPSPASESWGELLLVKATVAADLAIANLTVGDLFRLERGSILATSHLSGTNVPLLVGGRVLAWGEFQVNGETLGVRVAEMA